MTENGQEAESAAMEAVVVGLQDPLTGDVSYLEFLCVSRDERVARGWAPSGVVQGSLGRAQVRVMGLDGVPSFPSVECELVDLNLALVGLWEDWYSSDPASLGIEGVRCFADGTLLPYLPDLEAMAEAAHDQADAAAEAG